ncbi:hypothetical protein BH10ACT5_BH10ACT5_04970 [soil metagenome]
MAKGSKVERPTKKSEYEIRFATIRGPLVDTWDFLTRSPLDRTPTNYPLRGELQFVTRDGATHERWQHKPTLQGDARIWFYVVHLEQVHTLHPNQTK